MCVAVVVVIAITVIYITLRILGQQSEGYYSCKSIMCRNVAFPASHFRFEKAYDTLIFGYGVGENARRFIKTIWDGECLTPKQAGYYAEPFRVILGVR